MNRSLFIILPLLFCVFVFSCQENPDSIVGSRDHSIKDLEPTMSEILADGVSSVWITATVLNADNEPADSMKVVFETTAGVFSNEKSEDFEITSIGGEAGILLYSPPSTTDIVTTVTATVVDSAFQSLKKRAGNAAFVNLHIGKGPEKEPVISLKKQVNQTGNTATIQIRFVGVSLVVTAQDTIVPADGLSTTDVAVELKETSSGEPIRAAEIRLGARRGRVPGTAYTDEEGVAHVAYRGAKPVDAGLDTLKAAFGNEIYSYVLMTHVVPTFELTVSDSQTIADGSSQIDVMARLRTHKNTPISGAKIFFSTTDGLIQASAFTNPEGLAQVTLTASQTVKPHVTITATYLSLRRTVDVEFVSKEVAVITFTDPDTSNILRNGMTERGFVIKVKDSADGLLRNATVTFTASHGTITPSAQTDYNGDAFVTYKVDAAEHDAVCQITARYGISRETINLPLAGIEFLVSTTQTSLVADGRSTATIRVDLKETTSHMALSGQEIYFSVDEGNIPTSAFTDIQGVASIVYTAGVSAGIANISAIYGGLKKDIPISLITISGNNNIVLSANSDALLRDGIANKVVQIIAGDQYGQPMKNTIINLSATVGTVPSTVITDNSGTASFTYTADAARNDETATIRALTSSLESEITVDLIGITMNVKATPDSVRADGYSTAQIRVEIKETTSNRAVALHPVEYSVDYGTISRDGATDAQGIAQTTYTSDVNTGVATIQVNCGLIIEALDVPLYINTPSSFLITAKPNFIWVKETGNLEQTTLTAAILDEAGLPVGDEYKVRFRILNAPDGVTINPVSGSNPNESDIIHTVNGEATVTLRSGTVSGTVQIYAELVDYPQIKSKTSRIVVRSGPAYMWIDPGDPNNVINHTTIAVEPGKANTSFGNPIEEILISAYFGDKYNNPIEEGTAVYFTTTGGIITTDATTDEKGQTSVILQNVNPFPFLRTDDPNQLTTASIPNPNDGSVILTTPSFDYRLWDFEGNEVLNTMGNSGGNDGLAVVLAYTWGVDQNNNPVKVWGTLPLVFSSGVLRFEAIATDEELTQPYSFVGVNRVTSLDIGESCNIYIRLYDIHGNPVAAGSQLNATTTAGKVSPGILMADALDYGYGYTNYHTALVNSLDPEKDEAQTAIVTIDLTSPNGSGALNIPIDLTLTTP